MIRRELESLPAIEKATSRLLREADAYGVFPTPVGRLLEVQRLAEAPPEASILSAGMIAQAPAHLRSALRRVGQKADALLDRRERVVHLNPETDHDGQRAFKRLHETAHDLLDWQHLDRGERREGFADDARTLSASTEILFEREANQGAAELLFQRREFATIASDYSVSAGVPIELSQKFGSSMHAAFRRYVETHRLPVAGVVLDPRPSSRDPLTYRRREAFCSRGWCELLDHPADWPGSLQAQPFSFVEQARSCNTLSPPTGVWSWLGLDQARIDLNVEAFTNTYRTFVMIWTPARQRFKRRRVLAATPA